MLQAGDVIDGRYQIVRRVSQSGAGIVYEGVDLGTEGRVTLKAMHGAATADATLLKRFRREALAGALVGSSQVAAVLDSGELPGGDPFMVLELVEGETLSHRLRRTGPLTARATVALALQLLDGLQCIHDAGIIHRNLKSANVLLVPTEEGDAVKILDLGACKLLRPDDAEPPSSATPSLPDLGEVEERTEIGRPVGTVAYMAPEYIERGSAMLDSRADLYSVGVLLYRCLSDAFPCSGTTPAAVLAEIYSQGAVPITERVPALDPRLAQIIERSIERDPALRFQTAQDFRSALLDWSDTETDRVTDLLGDFLDVPPESRRRTSGELPKVDAIAGARAVDPRAEETSPHDKATAPPPPDLVIPADAVAPPQHPSGGFVAYRPPTAEEVAALDERAAAALDIEIDVDLGEEAEPAEHATRPAPSISGTLRMEDAELPPPESMTGRSATHEGPTDADTTTRELPRPKTLDRG